MRIKSVSVLRGGEILAEPVLTEQKDILIPKGTELKSDYVPLIQSLGVDSLMIEDPYENYEMPHPILDRNRLEYYVERVRKLLEGHIYHGKGSLRAIDPLAHEMVDEINDTPEEIVVDMIERSTNLYEHTVMVTLLSILVSKKQKISKDNQYEIAIGCLLHDLGIRYITVPFENCDWNDFAPNEVFEYRKHTILAYTALEEENWVPAIAKKMILSHHEKMDGSGFPLKQRNHEIECKIIQVCDAFDCFISGMECKRITIQEALSKLSSEAGSIYEKKVVEELVSMIARYPVGTTVKTSQEEHGVVISQTNDPENPVIMILDSNMNFCNEDRKYNLEIEKNISILQVV